MTSYLVTGGAGFIGSHIVEELVRRRERVCVLASFGTAQRENLVVCTDLGTGSSWANRDGETGLVVSPRDPDALASAIARLLDDEELRHAMGARAAIRAQEEFSAAVMIDRVLALYAELLEDVENARLPDLGSLERSSSSL